ncbi:MAG TPA: PEP-CTERM sorting domain-containing protein, partial [Burkholderiales bacterium]|nr:PEP-CTERM sorting domain-containing protein [Burkholderiales bacterium]
YRDVSSLTKYRDGLHPTHGVHRILADAMLTALGIPEPDTIALFAMALLTALWARGRRSKQA